MRDAAYSARGEVMEGKIPPPDTRSPIRRMLGALIAFVTLGVLLAISSGLAEAATTTFTVNRTGDAEDRDISDGRCDTSANKGNQCTLRAALEEANDTSGEDTIRFRIGDTDSVKTISPASQLPTVTDPVIIDGYTQSGATENTLEEGNDAVLKVQLRGSDAGAFANGLRIEAANSTIKGLVINRFGRSGIDIVGVEASGNSVVGNFIGTNARGIRDLGNGGTGLVISSGAPDDTVGGTEPEAANIISGNHLEGVIVAGARNSIKGNLIGTAADGSSDLGNGTEGVQISILDNTIGGTEPGAANTISRNGGSGVLIDTSTATGNSVLSNEIYANDGLGIDLNNDGVTNNDVEPNGPNDDSDTRENNLQNFPVIDSATWNTTTGVTTITGTLSSNPNQSFTIQCFLTGNQTDPSGHGEGAVLLDTTSTSTNSEGNAAFECGSQEAPIGREVSATATRTSTGDTSEFSENQEIFGSIPPP